MADRPASEHRAAAQAALDDAVLNSVVPECDEPLVPRRFLYGGIGVIAIVVAVVVAVSVSV